MNQYHTSEESLQLLVDSIDLHVHSAPSPFNRALDGMEVIRDAAKYKMAGILLKSHYEPTSTRATLINKYSHVSTKAYGGLTLNWPTGGLNPFAVENAVKNGAKIIWMPTRDAANSLIYGNMPGDFFDRPGISIFDENQNIKDSVYEIFEVLKKNPVYLATGHLSPKESISLCYEGTKYGIPMILTHPDFPRTRIDLDMQIEMANLGVMIEKNWFNVANKAISKELICHSIHHLSTDHVFIASDRGQAGEETPAEAMLLFVELLLNNNFTHLEIKKMITENPHTILSGYRKI